MIENATKFLEKYIEDIKAEKNEMRVSYDLWEMHEGVSIYSLACIFAANAAMLSIYRELEDEEGIGSKLKQESYAKQREIIEKEQKYIRYMKEVLPKINTEEYNILISHDPENFEMYEKLNVDLIFSGHIHGGLIRFGKICLLSPRRKFFPKYSYGKNTLNNTTIITTSGIGNATIPIRLFNRPEIVEVILGK